MSLALGLFSMTTGPCSHPEGAARVARAAEAAGFDSLWGGEHVVLPDPQAPPSPLAPEDRITDPIVALAFLAAHTTRIRLGTGIIILPQRNPLVLAKQLATLDVFSGGRLIFGVGVGYLEPEFRALGIPFETRGPMTDEYLAAMRTIWSQERPAYRGRFVAFDNVQAIPSRSSGRVRRSWWAGIRPLRSAARWSRGEAGTDSRSTRRACDAASMACATPAAATSGRPRSARSRSA